MSGAVSAQFSLYDNYHQQGEDVIKLATRLVSVPVTVLDKRKQYVTGLKAEDFLVFEDGKRQEIAFFSTELQPVVSRPMAIVFALDSSGSAALTIRQQRAAATALLSQLSDDQLIAVVRFSSRPQMLISFSKEKERIADAFSGHTQVGGSTAIFDAALFSIEMFKSITDEEARQRRKVVILISDGLDTASQHSYVDVVNKALSEDVSIYVAYLPLYVPGNNGRLEPRPTTQGFDRIAKETGGQLFQVGDVQTALNPSASIDLKPVFDAIINELRSQYYIGYYPSNPDFNGKFRQVQVQTRQSGLKLHLHKRGYYAVKEGTGDRTQK